ncbi:MAG: hypothetical protein LDL13_06480 [Calditerrivibrio sp.]|nr:hypothetical protein [Calditerrivibrio sp.]MCA1933205.1 hypothetical protein [Calditerrivibrio sp.]MCA1979996.1 hypothetical protein [Calditerrivibrio sp.]
MLGLKNLLVGVIVLFIGSSFCYGESTFYIIGDPFDPIVRSFLLSLEKADKKFNYQFVDKIEGEYGFDVANRVLYLEGQPVSLKYGIKDIMDRYLSERFDAWKNSYFIVIQSSSGYAEDVVSLLREKKIGFSLAANNKDVDLVINNKKGEIGKKKVIFLVAGGENSMYRDLIIPMFFRRVIKNMDIVVLAEHLCGRVMDQDNMVGLKGVEFYSFVSCLGDDEVKNLAEKIDNDYLSAIIGIESFYFYKNSVEGNQYVGRFLEKVENNRYNFVLNGYVVMGDGSLRLLPLVRQIELK